MSVTRSALERPPRLHVGCDGCAAGGWIGPRPPGAGADGWCEACQRAVLVAPGTAPACDACGGPLSLDSLRSEELLGEIQHLVAVTEAWRGNPGPLAELLPDRPRFLTDLTPPAARPGDEPAIEAALRSLAAGEFAVARARLEALIAGRPAEAWSARLWRALAVAAERLGDLPLAESAWTRALDGGENPIARLARGSLRARRGDYAGARVDLARAGNDFEAGWNRAALAVIESIAESGGMPPAAVLAQARAEAGESSSYWSSPTVGRLLWTLLVERAAAPGRGPEVATLRAAEREFEHDTFWDRALVAHGYAVVGAEQDAARVVSALAREGIALLLEEPCLRGRAARPIADALRWAGEAVAALDPGRALEALEPLMARRDLARYRVPCEHCGRGTVGIDQVEEESGE